MRFREINANSQYYLLKNTSYFHHNGLTIKGTIYTRTIRWIKSTVSTTAIKTTWLDLAPQIMRSRNWGYVPPGPIAIDDLNRHSNCYSVSCVASI